MSDQSVNDQETPTAQAAEDPEPAPSTRPSPGEDALVELRRERDTLQDRLLRTAAEFDNYRKRVERERRELIDVAASDVLAELLPILDNFERALQATHADVESLRAGIDLIHKQLLDLLKKRGVAPVDAVGTEFNPNIHEAVLHEESHDHREGEVMEELQRGYRLRDRLLRPAMVKVAKRS